MKQLFPVHSKAELACSIAIACFLLILVEACDLFRTRIPEEPEIGGSNYIPATEPSLVFENIKNAFADKNGVNYKKSFTDSNFVFQPSAAAQAMYSTLFSQWGIQEEIQYFTALCNKSTPLLEWNSLKEESRKASVAEYSGTYRLFGLPNGTTAEGRVQLTLVLTSSQVWVIERWIDHELSNDKTFTWSLVKATYVQ